MIDLILKTGINQYMEFKSVDASFVSDAEGKLENVPDSRSAIFKNRSLSLTEKNQLMKFFKLVQGHFGNGSEEDKFSEQDLERPFVEFLTKMGLSQKLKSYRSILHFSLFFSVSESSLFILQLMFFSLNCFASFKLYAFFNGACALCISFMTDLTISF